MKKSMITCRINGHDYDDEIENFHDGIWTYEYLDREDKNMKVPIQRFRCKEKKYNINV